MGIEPVQGENIFFLFEAFLDSFLIFIEILISQKCISTFPPNFLTNIKIFDFHQFEKLTDSNLRAGPLKFELVSLDYN